jgi:branched-subunit amino acid aminotransferase/4-amino-4-deoxychorismate lyase
MENRNYIWLNGEFTNSTQPILNITNRSFAYGDGFFETIHAYGTEAKHLNLHFNRIVKSMQVLAMEVPPYLNQEFLAREITRLLNKNRDFGSARVRLTVFRNEGGLYTPTNNTVSIAIHAAALPQNFYPLNTKGLVVDIYTDMRKPINILSPLKSCNAQLYVLAGLYKQQAGLDDCLIINDQNRIAEASSSNVFVVKDNIIHTPAISEGCVAGVMRQVVISLAPKAGYKIVDNSEIKPDMLINADEIFLTNSISGIQWIVGLRHKRYFGVVSRKLSTLLNKETFADQFKEGFSG